MTYPKNKGTTTYKITEIIRVSQGTSISVTPKYKAANGAKAKIIIRSLIDTCNNVKFGSPLVRLLHTKTIAVHGATPNRIIPAIYSFASSGETSF